MDEALNLKHAEAIRPGSLVVAYRPEIASSNPYMAIKREGVMLIVRDLGLAAGNFKICRVVEVRRAANRTGGSENRASPPGGHRR